MYKPFKSVDEQVAILRGRGVITDNTTAVVLRREGYYQIVNGYKTPFIDPIATQASADDYYYEGVKFTDLHALFTFDRKLRSVLFGATTLAEAVIKTTCSYEFTCLHKDELNPYLNPSNYGTLPRKGKAKDLIDVLKKIIERNRDNASKSQAKEYIRHCIQDHEGEVPLWVLTNAMTFGQTTWFYNMGTPEFRGNVARSLEQNYKSSHQKSCSLDTDKLDTRFDRIKDFRNICAHDERLYCARPRGKENNTLFECLRDLHWILDKSTHLELLQKVQSLIQDLGKTIPQYIDNVIANMGIGNMDSYQEYVNHI